MQLEAGEAQPLSGGAARPLSGYAGQSVHAVAGIGDPERFFATLRGHGIDVLPHAFVDHHRYRASDFAFRDGLPVLMTEKDAVKCEAFADARMHAVPVRAVLPETFFDAVDARLRARRGAR